jgi:hypothetical protein
MAASNDENKLQKEWTAELEHYKKKLTCHVLYGQLTDQPQTQSERKLLHLACTATGRNDYRYDYYDEYADARVVCLRYPSTFEALQQRARVPWEYPGEINGVEWELSQLEPSNVSLKALKKLLMSIFRPFQNDAEQLRLYRPDDCGMFVPPHLSYHETEWPHLSPGTAATVQRLDQSRWKENHPRPIPNFRLALHKRPILPLPVIERIMEYLCGPKTLKQRFTNEEIRQRYPRFIHLHHYSELERRLRTYANIADHIRRFFDKQHPIPFDPVDWIALTSR